MTTKQESLLKLLDREPEPPCNCQKCQHRHEECVEFKTMNRPDYPYDRQWCRWYLAEMVNKI